MSGLRPQRRPKLPRSTVSSREIAQFAFNRIMHTAEVGAGGVWLSKNPLELDPTQLKDARNVFRYDGALQTWWGHSAKGTPASGEGPVMGIFNILQGGQGLENLRFTTRDCYRWIAGDWARVRETYQKGTVSGIAGSPTVVTGNVGTDWETPDSTTGTRVFPGDFFYFDADGSSFALDITTVGGDTSITLSGVYGGSETSGNYTIEKRFRGTSDDFFGFTEFEEKGYFSDGVDRLKVFDPTSPVPDTVVDSTNPTYVPTCRVVENFAERIFATQIQAYGRATPTPQLLAWCAQANANDWTTTGASFRYFLETPGGIQTLRRLDETIVLYKEFDIWFGVRTGQSEPPVSWEPKITSRRHGCLAYRSVVPIQGVGHVYLGRDDFYLLQPVRATGIGGFSVRDFLFNQISRKTLNRIQGVLLEEVRMVAWLLPLGESGTGRHHILLYDYNRDVFFGPFLLGQTNDTWFMGHFYRSPGDVTTIDELVGTIDDQTWFLSGAIIGSGGQEILFGDDSGKTNTVERGTDSYDGDTRAPRFITGAVNTNQPMEEGSTVRVTVVYRVPSGAAAPTIQVDLSDDSFDTVLASDTETLDYSGKTGTIRKAYFDFIVSAERIQARVTTTSFASTLEILELALDATPGGVEVEMA